MPIKAIQHGLRVVEAPVDALRRALRPIEGGGDGSRGRWRQRRDLVDDRQAPLAPDAGRPLLAAPPAGETRHVGSKPERKDNDDTHAARARKMRLRLGAV